MATNLYRVPNTQVGVSIARVVATHLTTSVYDPNEPDIVEVNSLGRGESKADAIRAIVDAYRYSPDRHARALIIHRPDLLSEGAQNALRKTLEELPPYLHVILVSNTEWK